MSLLMWQQACHDVIARGEVASSAIDATQLTYPLLLLVLIIIIISIQQSIGKLSPNLHVSIRVDIWAPGPNLLRSLLSVWFCHLRSVPQGGSHRVALEGFAGSPDASTAQPTATPQPTNPQQTLLLFFFSVCWRRRGRCQTDRTTKLLRGVKVAVAGGQARRVERKVEEGIRARPPPAPSSRTLPIPAFLTPPHLSVCSKHCPKSLDRLNQDQLRIGRYLLLQSFFPTICTLLARLALASSLEHLESRCLGRFFFPAQALSCDCLSSQQ